MSFAGTTLLADCRSDCEKVISACNTTIQSRDKEITVQKNAIDDLTTELSLVQNRADSEESSLKAWYHNPFITVGIGILVGGLTYAYLTH